MHRHLFLIAYDIASTRRRRQVLKLLKGHATGGQKSLYECWMSSGEMQTAMAKVRSLIAENEDRVMFIRLDPRASTQTLGSAIAPTDADYFYVA
jgi:CRISPR-associated protein Cas2